VIAAARRAVQNGRDRSFLARRSPSEDGRAVRRKGSECWADESRNDPTSAFHSLRFREDGPEVHPCRLHGFNKPRTSHMPLIKALLD
jgi:hypothetical protein